MKIPVKRVHSRHRRFIAPGAVWDLMFGFEAIGSDFEARYDLVIHYQMDYLFGGSAAYAGAIAAADAAASAANQANADTIAALGRKKRERLVHFCIKIHQFQILLSCFNKTTHYWYPISNATLYFQWKQRDCCRLWKEEEKIRQNR